MGEALQRLEVALRSLGNSVLAGTAVVVYSE